MNKWKFKATETFWKHYNSLKLSDQRAALEAFESKFKANPFDPSLNPHIIRRLSAKQNETVRSVRVLGDLRAVFVVRGDEIWSIDIGSHDIYKNG